MSRAMFKYTKDVLMQVSFDVQLFCKELQKALNSLLPYEVEELKDWVVGFIEEKPELNSCMALLE